MLSTRQIGSAFCIFMLLSAALVLERSVAVQAAAPAAAAPAAAPPVNPNAKQPPAPLNVSLTTRDGVALSATYYASLLGKEAVPVIMLHQYKGSRADFKDLALALQAKGCAVLVPDLRGHGQSTKQVIAGVGDRELNPALMKQPEIAAMVEQDVEACKSFLMEKNNAGELNINKLCLVGSEMGGVIAVNWAGWDWHWPALTTGKQGQDVKAIVLISPVYSFKGLGLTEVINNRKLATQWSWMIIVGDQSNNELHEAKRMDQTLDKYMPMPSDPAQVAEKQQLFFVPVATSLQGAKLLAAKKDAIATELFNFIDKRLVKQGASWSDRKTHL